MTSVLDSDVSAEIVRLKDEAGLTWNQIAQAVGMKKETVRARYRRIQARRRPPECRTSGLRPADFEPDEETVVRRAIAAYQRTRHIMQARARQVIAFDRGPAALAFVADHHFGDPSTDCERALDEAQLIADTPGMYAGIVGDLFNNYIIGRLIQIRLGARFSIPDEAALGRRYLNILGDKLRLCVAGNHDHWSEVLSGIPYFRDLVGAIAPDVIYDDDQIDVTVRVGEVEYPGRLRHRWRGTSIYNDSHGIERAYKWDREHGGGFLWAVGAHTHVGGLVREFRAGGRTGLALLCGSYKRDDRYARSLGLSRPNQATAVAIVFDERGMLGFSDLRRAVDYMRTVYR